MTELLKDIEAQTMIDKSDVFEEFAIGDTVTAHLRISEGTRSRIQQFEGVVIGTKNRGLGSSVTLRNFSSGIGVEKALQLYSPLLEKIVVKRRGRVRRAKLYYLRSLRGRAARIQAKV